EGLAYLQTHSLPIVLKADGLAAGKGVIICNSVEEACRHFKEMIVGRQFGEASSKVVVESFLNGIEVSVFVLTNGKDYQIIGHAKDYKRIGEGDTGLNTGGMGCVTPVPFMDDAFMQKVTNRIIEPTIKGLQANNLTYYGFIFFGLMNCNGEPYLIEYNCRLGDPETEVVLPRLETDLVSLFAAMDNGTLADANINFSEESFATVIAVSGGYPGNYAKGFPISGLENATNSFIYHAGTTLLNDTIVTNGGRVLAVTSSANSLKEAVNSSLNTLTNIHFNNMFYRKDIGYEFF
ncbi:MAG: phosphoribosylamine--glycine ligase, partial [Chitinophagaceae bacterium]